MAQMQTEIPVRFDRIEIDPEALSYPLTGRILERLPDTARSVSDAEAFGRAIGQLPLTRGKRVLRLTVGRGALVKPCPATSEPYLCCRYTVLNAQSQCPMDCAYCVLQAYLNSPCQTVFVNMDDILEQAGHLLDESPGRLFRIGTGELADSLALDELTSTARECIEFFAARPNALFELKTKTVRVDGALDAKSRRAVLSWSVNPPSVVAAEEHGAAPLERRLEAAARCAEAGFLIGFHFDPILDVPDCEREYADLADRLFDAVDPSRVAWISLGSLRYPPALGDVIRMRFPKSRIGFGEMIRGLDGKMRYPRPLRTALYRSVVERIRRRSDDVFVYFCMESRPVWEKVMGFAPRDNADLDFRFAESLHRRFPEMGFPVPEREEYSIV
jgi:spore photoproduct lyase